MPPDKSSDKPPSKAKDMNVEISAAPSARKAHARIRVSDLLHGAREVTLEHDGQDYRLRVTANGKLILTK